MRIERLEFRNKDLEWQLAPVDFFPNLTLLVGISGVGKTRILRAIRTLKNISRGQGENPWGVEWEVAFTTSNGNHYHWQGEYEPRPSGLGPDESLDGESFLVDNDEVKQRPKIISELLSENGEKLVERDLQGISLRGQPTPKLSPYKSVLDILNEEGGISTAHEGFEKILFVDNGDESGENEHIFFPSPFASYCRRYSDLESIRDSKLPTHLKLALAYEKATEIFRTIADRFMSVFPEIEDVSVRRAKKGPFEDVPELVIRERGTNKGIPAHRMSSGMLRTLMHLSRMVLWPDGTVVLIDEFENSLGVNCIDFVTEDLVAESRRLQFIITSHHPYIINNISTKYWKIVSRKGSVVSTKAATDLGLEKSRHQAFLQLLNLEEYREGVAVQ
jgi:AAA domain, putative AbiEii toxin, Type IV TA system